MEIPTKTGHIKHDGFYVPLLYIRLLKRFIKTGFGF